MITTAVEALWGCRLYMKEKMSDCPWFYSWRANQSVLYNFLLFQVRITTMQATITTV